MLYVVRSTSRSGGKEYLAESASGGYHWAKQSRYKSAIFTSEKGANNVCTAYAGTDVVRIG
jgi:hypothetical protein